MEAHVSNVKVAWKEYLKNLSNFYQSIILSKYFIKMNWQWVFLFVSSTGSLFRTICWKPEESSLKGKRAIERTLSHYAPPFPTPPRFTPVLYRQSSPRNTSHHPIIASDPNNNLITRSFAIPYRSVNVKMCIKQTAISRA